MKARNGNGPYVPLLPPSISISVPIDIRGYTTPPELPRRLARAEELADEVHAQDAVPFIEADVGR
jgi:hypothetical protein